MNIEWYVYWVVICGFAANMWLIWKTGKILGHLVYAAAAAASFTRFAWACGKEHGFRERRLPRFMYAPWIWFEFFITELGAPKGSISHMGGAGVWKGIGKWTVFPRKEGGQ
ncbi:hypothetical protein ACIPL1_24815 [Pseudomonas sp. NPDC090202]|uniref:hypothetical protein n=1 Tax=Pseudomonas sp. NPDC090202 TaxID=3364476 RepID=UPI00380D6F67